MNCLVRHFLGKKKTSAPNLLPHPKIPHLMCPVPFLLLETAGLFQLQLLKVSFAYLSVPLYYIKLKTVFPPN